MWKFLIRLPHIAVSSSRSRRRKECVEANVLRRTDICPEFCGGQRRVCFLLKLLRTIVKQATRSQVLYRQHNRIHDHWDLSIRLCSLPTGFCGVYNGVNGTATRHPDHLARILHAQATRSQGKDHSALVSSLRDRGWRFYQCFNMFQCERNDILH